MLASLFDNLLLPFLASAVVGGAIFIVLQTVFNMLRTDDLEQDDAWQYDVTRINELRRISVIYRVFQPVIQLLAKLNQRIFRDQMPELNRSIQVSGLPRVWTGAEYLARIEVICIFLLPGYVYCCTNVFGMGPSGSILAVLLVCLTGFFMRRRVSSLARYRLLLIKRRLPFLLDLLTLLMEAGSTFLIALRDSVDEFRDHPVGVEFGRALAELSMGKTRIEAFEAMRNRLDDDEITSIIGSIIQGEQLGTPLAFLFRTQADVLRIKRTQRAEKLAGEAGVKMLLPGILIMAATVIVILGPFILNFIYTDFL